MIFFERHEKPFVLVGLVLRKTAAAGAVAVVVAVTRRITESSHDDV